MLREITPSGSGPRLWRERRARGGGGGARALVRGARVVEAAGVGRRLLSGPCRLISGRPRSGPALAPACSSTQSCHSQRGSSSPAALMSASIRPAVRGQGFRVRGQGRGSASRAASIRRLRERPAARRQSSRRRGERRCTRAWRGRPSPPRRAACTAATPGRSACSAGRGRCGQGRVRAGTAGRVVGGGAERSRSGASGVGAGGAAAGKAATHPAGPPLERAAGRRRWLCMHLCGPLEAVGQPGPGPSDTPTLTRASLRPPSSTSGCRKKTRRHDAPPPPPPERATHAARAILR